MLLLLCSRAGAALPACCCCSVYVLLTLCSLQWLPLQDNEPLMRALSNLINLNQPDLVLFVGEALVGNDAGGYMNTDQLGCVVVCVFCCRGHGAQLFVGEATMHSGWQLADVCPSPS